MAIEFLYNISLQIIFVIFLILFPMCAFAGYAWGSYVRKKGTHNEDATAFIPSTVLGLLALVLGFTLSMAVNRYDERKRVVLKEANAIGTAYLRADVLSEPFRSRIKENLRKYVDVRIAFSDSGGNKEKLQETLKQTDALQKVLWTDLMEGVAKDNRVAVGLLISEMNAVIDVSAERLFAKHNHVPELVYVIIMIITGMGLGSIGYTEGLSGHRTYFGVFMLSLLFSVVIVLIQDLDRPSRGLIRVDQQSLHQLKDSF